MSDHSYDDCVVGRMNTRRKKHIRRNTERVNLKYMFQIGASHETSLDWLKNRGFIPKILFCTVCQQKMKFEPSELAIDGYVWTCKECPSQLSARHGCWLEGWDAPLSNIFIFIYMWVQDAILEIVASESDMSLSTAKDWNVKFLNIIASVYENKISMEDEFPTINVIEKKISYAAKWRRKNKPNERFIEFLKIANSIKLK